MTKSTVEDYVLGAIPTDFIEGFNMEFKGSTLHYDFREDSDSESPRAKLRCFKTASVKVEYFKGVPTYVTVTPHDNAEDSMRFFRTEITGEYLVYEILTKFAE